MNNQPITGLRLLGTPVGVKSSDIGRGGTPAGSDGSGGSTSASATQPTALSAEEEQTSIWDDYATRGDNGNLVITPQGIGGGFAGLGALGGALLPGKDTPFWKRMLYSLLGAGALGTAGYFGGKHLGSNPGWDTGWKAYNTDDENTANADEAIKQVNEARRNAALQQNKQQGEQQNKQQGEQQGSA